MFESNVTALPFKKNELSLPKSVLAPRIRASAFFFLCFTLRAVAQEAETATHVKLDVSDLKE